MKTIVLAAAQMTCQDGNVQANLEQASALAFQARQKGAHLVLFPEFMPPGYRLTSELWEAAEPFDGPTTGWLRETARKLDLYLGTSFLEARNGHFLNTFALATPEGKITGRVCKRYPSIWEAYFFRGQRTAPYLDTDLGRIGVGICFDNHTYDVAQAVAQSGVDLMLMPHSYCTPTLPGQAVTQADIDRLNGLPGQVARLYNRWFGAPVVVCNKSGSWDSPVPKTILGQPKDYRFSGRSLILDGDGRVKAALGEEEAVITGPVSLDADLKKQAQPEKHSRYIYPGPAGREVLRIIEGVGQWHYTWNAFRQRKGRELAVGA